MAQLSQHKPSWANLGYLVAAEVASDNDTKLELEVLAQTHGIGVISLSANETGKSRVLIPAREKATIDWRACERLFSASSDFQAFLKQVLRFYQTDELPTTGWLVDTDDG